MKDSYTPKMFHPEYVVRDICNKYPNVDMDFVREVLKNRGINKALLQRRMIIKLGHRLKDKISISNTFRYSTVKGLRKELVKTYEDIKHIKTVGRDVEFPRDTKLNGVEDRVKVNE